MSEERLNSLLQCTDCGTVRMAIPPWVEDDTVVACATCQKPLGRWLDLKHGFHRQIGSGAFLLEDGQFEPIPRPSVAKAGNKDPGAVA